MTRRSPLPELAVLLVLALGPVCGRAAPAPGGDLVSLLSRVRQPLTNDDALPRLFRLGDARVSDLIALLDHSDRGVSIGAQIALRYLANPRGMKGLRDWLGVKGAPRWLAGPVPTPLDEWDYGEIRASYLEKPARLWDRRIERYVYALLLDGSSEARAALDRLNAAARQLPEMNSVRRLLERSSQSEDDASRCLEGDPLECLKQRPFFVAPADRRYVSWRLLAMAPTQDRVLVEAHINRGPLAEEWFYLVLRKSGSCWRVIVIDPIAVS